MFPDLFVGLYWALIFVVNNACVSHGLYSGNFLALKSVQSALSDLKRPPERLQYQCNYRPFILNNILMAHFLKQNFTQTCLKETDNGKLKQFNY